MDEASSSATGLVVKSFFLPPMIPKRLRKETPFLLELVLYYKARQVLYFFSLAKLSDCCVPGLTSSSTGLLFSESPVVTCFDSRFSFNPSSLPDALTLLLPLLLILPKAVFRAFIVTSGGGLMAVGKLSRQEHMDQCASHLDDPFRTQTWTAQRCGARPDYRPEIPVRWAV